MAEELNTLWAALNHIREGVIVLDAEQRVRCFNPRVCELLDLPVYVLSGQPSIQAVTQWQQQRGDFGPQNQWLEAALASYISKVAAGDPDQGPEHYQRVTHNGRTLDIYTRPLADGGAVRIFADITAQVLEHHAYTRLNELAHQVQMLGRIGGWEVDLIENKITWTEGTYQIFDTAPGQFTPAPDTTRALFTPQAWRVVRASYEDTVNQPELHQFDVEMLTVTGRHIWVHSSGHTVWRNGQPVRRTAIVQDITERKQAESEVWAQAHFDSLTGLPNRRMLRERLEQALRHNRRERCRMALLFVDLDHFKEINDTLGHDQGDQLLVEAARRIRGCVREADTVARMGGDEFTVLMTDLQRVDRLEGVLQKMLNALSIAFELTNEQVFVSASIGVTVFPDDATTIEGLLRNADQALYAAKGAGRNRYRFFTPALQETVQQRAQVVHDLRIALTEQQLRVYYQPIVDLISGTISKAEALVRWQHPQRGLVSPAEFIPIAESSGLIGPLGEWVFQQAAEQARRWRTTLHPHFQISVNKSPVQFENPDPQAMPWIEQLRALGLDGTSIVVEITEGLLLSDSNHVIEQLLRLSDDGIQVSLDDFGTGYSSLAYLQKFDIDYIKIDRSFVRQLVAGSTDLALCQAIIAMAHTLGMKVIAEGIETDAQRQLLTDAGCDFGQGFLFSAPLPADAFEALLDTPWVSSGFGALGA